jgi:hypothetical protein
MIPVGTWGRRTRKKRDERSADEEEDHFRVDTFGLALKEDSSVVWWVRGQLLTFGDETKRESSLLVLANERE